MKPGYLTSSFALLALALLINCTTADHGAPAPVSADSFYSNLLSSFSVPTQNPGYGAQPSPSPSPSPAYGGYPPSPAPAYGSPSSPAPAYGLPPAPAPAPVYGAPAPAPAPYDNAYDTLRDFSTSAQSAFVQRRLFNTSVALTVPLFSFTLPQRASQGSTVDLANQAIFGLFSLLVVVLIFAVPILFTGSRPGYSAAGSGLTGRSNAGGSNGILDNLMAQKNVINFMGADLTNNIGLDVESCLKKTICEAHRFPKKYGLVSMPFKVFFPPPTGTGSSARVVSSYQLAAADGTEKKNCGKLYKCFFDVLDLIDYFLDWWKYSTDPNSNLVLEQ